MDRDKMIGGLKYWEVNSLSQFTQPFIQHFFMCRMLIDNIQFILKLNQPVRIKDLTDQLMTASGFRARSFSSKIPAAVV